MTNKIRNIIHKSSTAITCVFLYIRHIFLLKPLRVEYAGLQDAIIIEGNPAYILISARGCHRMSVSGKFLSGNIKEFELRADKMPASVTIIFHGILKTISKDIFIRSCRLELITQFHSESSVPVIEASHFSGKEAVSALQHITLQSSLSSAIQISMPTRQLTLDPFELNKYI